MIFNPQNTQYNFSPEFPKVEQVILSNISLSKEDEEED